MSTMNMKPNRIALFLAKILGKPEGENIKPSNATEYYLNEIAKNGGGGGVTVVTFENSLDSPDVYTPNMTREEMGDAAPNGIIGVCIRHSTRGDNYFQMYPEGHPVAVSDFYRVRPISNGIRVERLLYNLDTEKWDLSYVDYSLTPST